MDGERPQTFEEFWPIYVRGHSKSATRLVHFIGTTSALALLVIAIYFQWWWLLVAVPVVGYGLAWASHALAEHNRPLTFGKPWWSLRADFRMWRLMLLGGMKAEVARACGAPQPPASPVGPAR